MSTFARLIENIDGCTCTQCQPDRASANWALALRNASVLRQHAVAWRESTASTMTRAAQDYGLVPHKGDCGGCAIKQRTLKNAAAVIGFEYRHPVQHVYHVTAWAMAAPVNGHLPA